MCSVLSAFTMATKRGALIVIEGVDRTGKSTQSKQLVQNLISKQIQAEYKNFPDRTTEIGNIINGYLTSKYELSDQAIHLLFSANRREVAKDIIEMLQKGISVIVDRYCYSGVAFSAAKGLDLNWCKATDAGLPKPDKVFFLTMPMESVMQRKGFGDERYEVIDFQKKVSEMYQKLHEENWEVLDANRTIKEIEDELLEKSLNVINTVGSSPIGKMWVS